MSKFAKSVQCYFSKNLLHSAMSKRRPLVAPVATALKSLKELGYGFNDDGELKKLNENGEPGADPFEFKISELHQQCQLHYESVGMAVTDYVYDLLENQEHLLRLQVPVDTVPATGTFIYATKEYDKKDVLVILIHGSGVVRAGQWARSLIINENLNKGTQIPYIRQAVAKDYGVMLLNTNDNYRISGNKIPKSGTPQEHANYVWTKYVANTKARSVVIVAHSFGGVVALGLASKFKSDFKSRVKAIALTDSVHGFSVEKIPDYVLQISRNWIASSKPLDTPESTPTSDIPMVSAGHRKHEMTSHSSKDSIFKFFEEKVSNT